MKYFPRVLSSLADESLFCLKARSSFPQLEYGQSVVKFYKQSTDVCFWFKDVCAQADIPFNLEKAVGPEELERSFYIAVDDKQIKYLSSESVRVSDEAFVQSKMAGTAIKNYNGGYHRGESALAFIRPYATSIMGVLNITPDSFSDGGEYFDENKAVGRAALIAQEGADILDVGGQSSRPGAEPISSDEELRRVIPVISKTAGMNNITISIDTYRSRVAREALEAGASIINDISALTIDKEMVELAAEKNCPIILMHMQGDPLTMQKSPTYESVCDEVYQYLYHRCEYSRNHGIDGKKIIIDPGIGFGKTTAHNLEVLKELDSFRSLGYPVLVGPSRKSFIGNILNLPVSDRLEGTLSAVVFCAVQGASIVRVHDVKEAKRALLVVEEIMKA
ncbi:MAG: dihydropteroate synthase [Actinobacteria bacterium]|nr:dihydropteroate synthase [Actinomycetota bacterium]